LRSTFSGRLFDVHSVATHCDEQFAGRGQEISNVWRQKQLEYTWLRSLMNRYIPFEQVTEEALRFTLRHLKLELDENGGNESWGSHTLH
jgi:2-haloacid dehalogenase